MGSFGVGASSTTFGIAFGLGTASVTPSKARSKEKPSFAREIFGRDLIRWAS
jgi:hypothetical protein